MYADGNAARSIGTKSTPRQAVPLGAVRELADKHLEHLRTVAAKAREFRVAVRTAVYDAPPEAEAPMQIAGDVEPGLAGRLEVATRLLNDIEAMLADARQAIG